MSEFRAKESGETNLSVLISSMQPKLVEGEFVFCSLTEWDWQQLGSLQPMGTFQESEGMTVIVEESKAKQCKLNYQQTYRCITLSVHSSLDAVGLTAAFSNALARAGISANVIAGYYHDHIFVNSMDAQQALQQLMKLANEGI